MKTHQQHATAQQELQDIRDMVSHAANRLSTLSARLYAADYHDADLWIGTAAELWIGTAAEALNVAHDNLDTAAGMSYRE